jgi:hypothetical protein
MSSSKVEILIPQMSLLSMARRQRNKKARAHEVNSFAAFGRGYNKLLLTPTTAHMYRASEQQQQKEGDEIEWKNHNWIMDNGCKTMEMKLFQVFLSVCCLQEENRQPARTKGGSLVVRIG